MSTIKERILTFIQESDDAAFIRPDVAAFGSRSGVGRALRQLVDERNLIRLGYGAYAPAKNGRATFKLGESVMEVLRKLGAEPSYGGQAWREWQERKTTQIPAKPTVTVRRRVTRSLGRGNTTYRYEYDLDRGEGL